MRYSPIVLLRLKHNAFDRYHLGARSSRRGRGLHRMRGPNHVRGDVGIGDVAHGRSHHAEMLLKHVQDPRAAKQAGLTRPHIGLETSQVALDVFENSAAASEVEPR